METIWGDGEKTTKQTVSFGARSGIGSLKDEEESLFFCVSSRLEQPCRKQSAWRAKKKKVRMLTNGRQAKLKKKKNWK